MTKKDYIKLADTIKHFTISTPDMIPYLGRDAFVDRLCDLLKDDNPRFDKERFITACK